MARGSWKGYVGPNEDESWVESPPKGRTLTSAEGGLGLEMRRGSIRLEEPIGRYGDKIGTEVTERKRGGGKRTGFHGGEMATSGGMFREEKAHAKRSGEMRRGWERRGKMRGQMESTVGDRDD